MNIYIWIFLGLLFLSQTKYKNQKSLFKFAIVVSILFAGLRGVSVGVDTEMYSKLYLRIGKGLPVSHFEYLYLLINKLCAWLKFPVWGMQLVASSLTMIPLYFVIKKTEVKPILALFFYFALCGYLNSFNAVRQMIGVSFVMLAYTYYPDKIKSAIFILIGMGFHSSAVIGFLIFLIPYINIKPIYAFPLLIITFGVGLVINDQIATIFLGKYATYLTDPELSKSFGFRDNTAYAAMMGLLLDVIFVLVFNSSNSALKESKWFKLYFIMILLSNLTFKLVLGARIIMYFTMVQMILYPMLFRKENNIEKNPELLRIVVILYASSVFFKFILVGGRPYLPYILAI